MQDGAGTRSLFLRVASGPGSCALEGRPDEARVVLAAVYDRFTERFETADLRAAGGMLALPPV
jgi:hypothetical protein